MVMNKRVTRATVDATFDAFDVFRRGQITAKECVDVAAVYAHFLAISPQSLFAQHAPKTLVARAAAVDAIYGHIVGAASAAEAAATYDLLSSDTQPGPLDAIDVVGARFGPKAVSGSHPDGARLDPLLLAVASRATGERTTSRRVADAVLFVQNAASILYPSREAQSALLRIEWEELSMAAALLSPGANKRIWRRLHDAAIDAQPAPAIAAA